MAKVKIGRDVKNEGDLQNLVTGIILRADGEFTLEEILPVINWNLRGSAYHKSEKVEACLRKTLEIFENVEVVRYENGVYKVADVLFLS